MLLAYCLSLGIVFLTVASLETAEKIAPGILSFQPLLNPIHWLLCIGGILAAASNDLWRRRFARTAGFIAIILLVAFIADEAMGIGHSFLFGLFPANLTDQYILLAAYGLTVVAGLFLGFKKDRIAPIKPPHVA